MNQPQHSVREGKDQFHTRPVRGIGLKILPQRIQTLFIPDPSNFLFEDQGNGDDLCVPQRLAGLQFNGGLYGSHGGGGQSRLAEIVARRHVDQVEHFLGADELQSVSEIKMS